MTQIMDQGWYNNTGIFDPVCFRPYYLVHDMPNKKGYQFSSLKWIPGPAQARKHVAFRKI